MSTRTRVQSARARFAFEAGVDGPAGVDGALEDGAGSGIHLRTVVSSVVASALRKESSALRVESEANGTVRRGREDAEMAESEQTERSRGAAEGKCIPWQPAHHLLVVFTAFRGAAAVEVELVGQSSSKDPKILHRFED